MECAADSDSDTEVQSENDSDRGFIDDNQLSQLSQMVESAEEADEDTEEKSPPKRRSPRKLVSSRARDASAAKKVAKSPKKKGQG